MTPLRVEHKALKPVCALKEKNQAPETVARGSPGRRRTRQEGKEKRKEKQETHTPTREAARERPSVLFVAKWTLSGEEVNSASQ